MGGGGTLNYKSQGGSKVILGFEFFDSGIVLSKKIWEVVFSFTVA